MNKAGDDSKILPSGGSDAVEGPLPYAVELWRPGESPRLIARAAGIVLARAVFAAARIDFPDRRLTLSRGAHVLEDTGWPGG